MHAVVFIVAVPLAEMFDITRQQIKSFLLQYSVKINLVVVAVAGLPYSGKSTLLQSMLALKPEHHKEMLLSDNKVPGLSVYEAALMINQYSEEERCQWLPKVSKPNAETLMFAGSLAQVCARKKLSLSLLSSEDETNSAVVDIDPLFKSPLINDHFDKTYDHLKDLLLVLEQESSLDTLRHALLTFVNIWDIGVNKAVYEVMTILARRCRNLLLINVLNLEHDVKKFRKPLNLQDHTYYQGKYNRRNDEEQVLQVQNSSTYYTQCAMVCNQLENTTLLVGTHKDAFEGDKQKLKVTVSQVRQTVEAKLAPLRYGHALHPKMLVVDARNQEDAKRVCTEVDDMILQDGRFEKQVPLSWILLQGALESSGKMVMSKFDLWPLASECGLNDLEERRMARSLSELHVCHLF